jgi:hypothetical protein
MLSLAMAASAQKITTYYTDDLRVKDGLIEVSSGVTTSISFPNEVTMYHLTVPGTVDIAPDDEKKTLWLDTNGKKGSTGMIVKTGGVNLRFKVFVTARSTTPVVMVQERPEAEPEAAPVTAQNAPQQSSRPTSSSTGTATPTAPASAASATSATSTPPAQPVTSVEDVLPGARLELESRGIEAGVLTLVYRLKNTGKTRMVIDPARARFEGFEARVKTLQSQIIVAPGMSQVGVIEIVKPQAGRLNLMWEVFTDISTRTKGTIVKVIDVAQYLK